VETTRYYVDVNIFVYWLSKHPLFGDTAYGWIQKITNASPREYVTSSLAIYQAVYVLAGLAGTNLRNKLFVQQITTYLTQIKNLTIESLKPEDLTNAAELMNANKLDYEDALHLAVAKRTGVMEIITNDRRFNAANIKRTF
jgi:predicted nucleic acid-binding protein